MNHVELNNRITQKDEQGFYELKYDKQALDLFLEEVKSNMMTFPDPIERLIYLVEEDFYYDLFTQYDEKFLTEIIQQAYSYDFKFQSYMAATKFYKDYALKSNDKKTYLEDYEQHVVIVALYLAQGNESLATQLVESMMLQIYQPATPTFLNSGRKRSGELISCYLLDIDDSLNSINYNESVARQLSKLGGGVALNLSRLRARGEAIKDIQNVAKGVLPVAKSLEQSFAYVNQLGQRPGAGVVSLNIFHYDIPEFLDTKKVNADEDLRLATISTQVIIQDKFIELVKANQEMALFGPHSVYKAYGINFDEMNINDMYETLLKDDRVKKRYINARDLLTQIAKMQLQSGYPYLMFRDNANRQHPLKEIGQIKQSNLCTEIFQLQETSIINDYEDENHIKRDISCNLGSLNIVNLMENKNFRRQIMTAMKGLTAVSDLSSVRNAPGVRKANEELHSVGLGAMNLNGYLAKNQIQYESEETKDFVNILFMLINYYSILASNHIAKSRQTTFKDFEKSDYATGQYFDKYITQDIIPVTDKVKALFKGITIPTAKDWIYLKERVKKHGLYHAYRLAIAPTQSISYVQNATSSVMPVVEHIERRSYGNAETFYPMPFLSQETFWFYKSAFNVDQMKLIDLIATIQQHVDQGISTILYVNSNITTRELARYYVYAHHKGLKSLYYTRNKLLSVEECTSCAV